MNRVDTVGPPGRTVNDRGAAGVDLGAPGWEKNELSTPGGQTVHRGPPGPPRLAPVVIRCRYGSWNAIRLQVSPIYTAFSPRRDEPW